jgi:hypothetical protein
MTILVEIQKNLWSGGRVFRLEAAFASDKDVVVIFAPWGTGKSLSLLPLSLVIPGERPGCRQILQTVKNVDTPPPYLLGPEP